MEGHSATKTLAKPVRRSRSRCLKPLEGPVITIARFNPWLSSLLSLLRSEKIGGNTWAIKPSEYFDQYVARFHPAKMSRGSEFCQS